MVSSTGPLLLLRDLFTDRDGLACRFKEPSPFFFDAERFVGAVLLMISWVVPLHEHLSSQMGHSIVSYGSSVALRTPFGDARLSEEDIKYSSVGGAEFKHVIRKK